ncbi:MAG: hypothetical protein LBC35_07830 [Coriobacteriales bacterium]|jgi:hypothetical protein|nr:hypothetical protein [Coriobacteriales bacterium]
MAEKLQTKLVVNSVFAGETPFEELFGEWMRYVIEQNYRRWLAERQSHNCDQRAVRTQSARKAHEPDFKEV